MSNLNETNLLFDVASPIVTVLWDKIQKNEKCCGLQGQDDWLNSHFGKIPATCCNEGKSIYHVEQKSSYFNKVQFKIIFGIEQR